MRLPSLLTNLLALTIVLGSSMGALAVPSTPPTTPPAEASPEATCLTPDIVVEQVITGVPDADIKSVSKEPPYSITFTSPSMSTDYVVEFDENNCAVKQYSISKVQA